MLGEMSNLVVKVNIKKNVLERPILASVELLEALVSSGKADSVSDKGNGNIQVASGLSSCFRVIQAILMHYQPK
jgi:hypothetical protein